jgi:hypothetical protein
MDWKKAFAKWKYNYDISASFLGLINFILLSITASSPIQDFLLKRFQIRIDQFVIVGVLCGTLIIGFLLFGHFLDKVFKYWQNLMTIQNEKNPQLSEILKNSRDILEELRMMKK